MPKIQSYNDMRVDLINATPHPQRLVALALSLTVRGYVHPSTIKPLTHSLAKFLLKAEHTSMFEHVTYTFLIQGVSRSFLAQITRQRAAHPTSGSQHYQDYEDYPCSVHPAQVNQPDTVDALTHSMGSYVYLRSLEVAKEEARQVLPNAACVNYLWTIDARNLMWFLRQRCCNRNVLEMRIFANKILLLVQEHFPEWFLLAGPQCFMDGECKQGRMQCKETRWVKV